MRIIRLFQNFLLLFSVLLGSGSAAHAGVEVLRSDTTKPVSRKTDSLRARQPDSSGVYRMVEIEASFPGGDEAWINYLQNNLNGAIPVQFGAPEGTYTVIVQFVVDTGGRISDVKALTRHGFGMEAEVMRIIRRGPKWTPASQEGRLVKAYRRQPVTFSVTVEKKKRKNKD